MTGKTCHPEHAKQVIEVAINELDLLLKQRTAISKRVRAVKRTVKGLATLFGVQNVDVRLVCQANAPQPNPPGAGSSNPPRIEVSHSTDYVGEEVSAPRSNDAQPSSEAVCIDGVACKPKLERACRIALLESQEPASAGQIYDRISRRGSYPIGRYRHPLMRVIATLNMLVKEGEARTLTVGDCRCWQWNTVLVDTAEEKSRAVGHLAVHHDR